MQGFKIMVDSFNWDYRPDLKGKLVCCACGPVSHEDGTPSGFGTWHDYFARRYLPIGMFKTSSNGNLEHIKTGDTCYEKYILEFPDMDKGDKSCH